MPRPNYVSSLSMQAQAERELAAFLSAANEVSGQDNMQCASDTWLETMKSLDCPDEDYEKFFRRITILALSQLIACSGSQVSNEKADLGASRLSVA